MTALHAASGIDHLLGVVNVRAHGATGDGSTDDTSAIAAAYTAAAGKALFFPPGTYLVTTLPALDDGDRIVGAGPMMTEIKYAGTGTLLALTNKQDIAFRSIGFALTGAGAEAITLETCFQISFDDVCIRGLHTGASSSTYHGQKGLVLTDNTGNTRIHNSVLANLGVGIETSCIQNELTNSKITNCYTGIHGVGGTATAGLIAVGCEFIGDTDPDTVHAHIDIDGSANTWSLHGCWFEGSDYALIVGVFGSGGPSSFTMTGCKIAARVAGITFNNCRQPSLYSCEFNEDAGGTMTELVFGGSPAGDEVIEGIALNNVTTLRSDFEFEDFPQYWIVARKGQLQAPNFTSTSNVTVDGTVETGNLVVLNGSPGFGKVLTGPDSSGAATWQTPDVTQAELDAKVTDAIADGVTTVAPSQNAVFDALALKAPLASPTLTGTPAAPTATAGTNTTQIATTAFVTAAAAAVVADAINDGTTAIAPSQNAVFDALALKAPLASPALTGTPTAPTAAADTNTTQIATTAHVFAERANAATLTSKTLTTPVLNGTPTGTGVATAATASTLALRDANGNLSAAGMLEGYSTTATAAGTTTLTVSSNYLQYFTGTTTQTVTMPVASTLVLGQQWLIVNTSTGAVTVQSSGSNTIVVIAAGTSAMVTCILASGTGTASWQATYFGDVVTSGKKLAISNTLTLAGTDATTITFQGTDTYVGRATADTLTNKRLTPRVVSVASASTHTIDSDVTDVFTVTAQAAAVTFAAPTGTPTVGQRLMIRLRDNGTARAITWTTTSNGFASSGLATLLTTTVISKTHTQLFVWDEVAARWVLLAADSAGY